MLDPLPILKAMAGAALTAAAVVLLCAWPRRTSRPVWVSAGCVLGVGLGFFGGCWGLGLWPRWPPREDQGRLLFILFPAVLAVELVAVVPGRFHWLAWLPRLAIAAGAARILLHDTSYLTEPAGPGTREWTQAQTYLILGGLGAALAGAWAALASLARRVPGPSLPLALALTCAGAAVTVMLSGYASGGLMGLALAAALTGAMIASLALSAPPDVGGVLGLGVVGLFALLVIGRFFGQLTVGNAILLFFGPLLCWLLELPYVARLGPRLRGLLRVGLSVVPVIVALTLAQQKFIGDSIRTSPGSKEPSIQDYMDFGK